MAYFPMYIDICEKSCLIVGGGMVAYRKARVLLDFDARIDVVAEEFCEELHRLVTEDTRVRLLRKSYENGDCNGYFLVVAATDQSDVNHQIAEYCMANRILVNAVDQKEDCSFLFSSYVKENNLVASFSSSGNSPLLTQILKGKEEELLTPFLGELNEILGNIRPYVKEHFDTEAKRKAAYQSIYDLAVETQKIPTEEEIRKLLEEI